MIRVPGYPRTTEFCGSISQQILAPEESYHHAVTFQFWYTILVFAPAIKTGACMPRRYEGPLSTRSGGRRAARGSKYEVLLAIPHEVKHGLPLGWQECVHHGLHLRRNPVGNQRGANGAALGGEVLLVGQFDTGRDGLGMRGGG